MIRLPGKPRRRRHRHILAAGGADAAVAVHGWRLPAPSAACRPRKRLDVPMPYRFATLILAASVICATAPLAAAQSGWLRDRVRERGDITFDLIACGPLTGLKEIVQETELTVEGMVTLAESALTAAEDGVYTDYVIDVMRVFRVRSQTLTRSTPGPTGSLPFVADEPLSRPTAATTTRVRLRGLHSGRVVLDGGVVTARGGGPLLRSGSTSSFRDISTRAGARGCRSAPLRYATGVWCPLTSACRRRPTIRSRTSRRRWPTRRQQPANPTTLPPQSRRRRPATPRTDCAPGSGGGAAFSRGVRGLADEARRSR
jgi:hypothetical protein